MMGKEMYIYDNFGITDTNTLTQKIAGAASSGYWLLIDNIEKIELNLLSLIAQ